MISFLLGTLMFISVSSLVYVLLDFIASDTSFETRKIQSRLEILLQRPQASNILRDTKYSGIDLINRFFQKQKASQELQHLLSLSGWTIPINVFFLLLALGTLLAGLVTYAITHRAIVSAFTALASPALPFVILNVNKKRYVQLFTTRFPDALLMMRNALKAGQGVQGTFRLVAEEGPKPVASEFSEMVRQIELGSNMNEALNNMFYRIGTTDLRLFVLGIFIQQEIGGNLVELFDRIDATIRERLSLARELNALTAQGKLTGLMLVGLPVGLTLVLLAINPTYFDPLLKASFGPKVITFAVIMQVIGSAIIYKMTRFSIAS